MMPAAMCVCSQRPSRDALPAGGGGAAGRGGSWSLLLGPHPRCSWPEAPPSLVRVLLTIPSSERSWLRASFQLLSVRCLSWPTPSSRQFSRTRGVLTRMPTPVRSDILFWIRVIRYIAVIIIIFNKSTKSMPGPPQSMFQSTIVNTSHARHLNRCSLDICCCGCVLSVKVLDGQT